MRRGSLARDALLGAIVAAVLGATVTAHANHNWPARHDGRRWHHHDSIDVWAGANTNDNIPAIVSCATARSANYSWNYYTSARFVYHGLSAQNHAPGHVAWSTLDGFGGALALTHGWLASTGSDGHSVITTEGHVHLDQQEPYYYPGCSGDAPSNRYDLWSVIAHEAGHLLVLGDLGSGDAACPNSNSRATMCSIVHAGTERQRTPNTSEDISSANAAY